MSDKIMIVVDSSCTVDSPTRNHVVIVNGLEYPVEFIHGEQTTLPEEVAMRFAALEGFTVIDPEGRAVSLPKAVDNVVLDEDQVIAFYDELTIEALQVRAVSKLGGEELIGVQDRAVLVGFIKNGFIGIDGEDDLLDDDDEEGDGTDDFDPNGIDGDVKPPAVPVVPPVVETAPEVPKVEDVGSGASGSVSGDPAPEGTGSAGPAEEVTDADKEKETETSTDSKEA